MKMPSLTLVSLFLLSQSFALPPVRVDGNRFVDSTGKTLIFMGLNSSDPDKLARDGQWGERYFEEIANWGANIVRIPVHPKSWREHSPETYLAMLDQGVAWAERHNLYLIIDWHSIGNLREERFQAQNYETSLAETISFWRAIAQRYADNSTVAFYELFNEPTITGDRFGNMTWSQWKETLEEMIQAIREYDQETIVLAAGFDWAYDLTPVRDNPLEADNIAYVSHPYPQKRDQPWEPKWEAEWGFVSETYPVFLTEVGFCLENEKGAHIPVISTEEYGRALTAYAEKKGISWVAWVFDVDWSPMLISDWEFTPTTQGRFFKNYLQSKK